MKRPEVLYDEDDELPDFSGDFYTESETMLIYEAQLFEDFVIVRPASPAFYTAIRRLDYPTFYREFQNFLGDPDQVRRYLHGMEEEAMVFLG